jgi:magnesium-transporting ATPase (P-type)
MNGQGVADIEATSEAPLPVHGLKEEEASKRLREFGPNDPSPRRHGELIFELLLLFVNPLVVILLVASVLSAVLGQGMDAIIIFVIAMSSVAINFFQTYRSGKAIRRLREHVSLTASVLRDGVWRVAGGATRRHRPWRCCAIGGRRPGACRRKAA